MKILYAAHENSFLVKFPVGATTLGGPTLIASSGLGSIEPAEQIDESVWNTPNNQMLNEAYF